MITLRRWAVVLGLWLARWGGATFLALDADLMPLARLVVAESARQPYLRHGDQRHHAALRAMLNHHPTRERACRLAIEAAVQELS